MDRIDALLLNKIQTSFPIESQPYKILGDLVGVKEEDAWRRIHDLRQEGIIRRLGGVFDSRRLGYYSTLCAARVPDEKIPLISDMLLDIVGVTHNYLRNHFYNMWFTLIAPSESEVNRILEKIRFALGSDDVYSLPAKRVFKICVDLKFKELSDQPQLGKSDNICMIHSQPEQEFLADVNLEENDKSLVRFLQENLPSSLRPFEDIAADVNMTEEQLIRRIRELFVARVIRRFGAVLRHQKAGYTANAMGVWIVPEKRVEEVGKKMAMVREVSHCYQRPTLPDWPYNLFTMIHGRSLQECELIMEKIARATELTEYQMLVSMVELKKTSMLYFTE